MSPVAASAERDVRRPAAVVEAVAGMVVQLPVSDGRPPKPARPAPVDTGNTGKSEVADTGNDDADLLVILANKEIGHEQFDDSEWRIEVYTNRNGRRYWNHRRRGKRGGKDNWRYGGKFDDLNADRQAQYWQRAKGG